MDSQKPQNPDSNGKIIEEWSDRRCIGISYLGSFPAIVKDISIQKNIISRFLNFYLGGKVQKGLSARDIIFAVISIMPESLGSEVFIWDENDYSENGHLFFLTADDKLRFEIENVVSKKTVNDEDRELNVNKTDCDKCDKEEIVEKPDIPCNTEEAETNSVIETNMTHNSEKIGSHCTSIMKLMEEDHNKVDPENDTSTANDDNGDADVDNGNEVVDIGDNDLYKNLKWYRTKRVEIFKSESDALIDKKYGPVENAAFCISCNKLLSEWESSLEARTTLKFFFAMAALVVMRGKVKTYQNLTRYFSTTFFEHLQPFVNIQYSPPHRSFIKRSWKAFQETDNNIGIMFAKIVVNSFTQKEKLSNYGKQNILRFAILSHVANYKMGLIGMLQQVVTNSYNFKELFEALYSDETAASWNTVKDFFEKYMCCRTRQGSFHWACVIESHQFKHLSCTSNYELAVVIAVFIEKITENSGIWNSKWVSNGKNLETYKELGYKLFSNYQEKQDQFVNLDIVSMFQWIKENF